MKVAFVVDASIADTKSIRNNENVYVAPFMAYDDKGILTKIYDSKTIENLQKQNTQAKNFIEPTPGMYRDLYNEILQAGYDYIVVVPQHKNLSKSYFNADYVQRLSFEQIMVVDVTEYKLNADDVFDYVINDRYKEEEMSIIIDLEAFVSFVKGILTKLSTAM
jgi:fatty acid-binding protein DegV